MKNFLFSLLLYFILSCINISCDTVPEEFTNTLGIKFVRIENGQFEMGQEEGGDFDERPVHKVRISFSFLMSVTEITNGQYELYDPEHKKWRGQHGLSLGDEEAVVNVSWHDAVGFCNWLSEKEGIVYRLPT